MSNFNREEHLKKARHSIPNKCRNCGELDGKHKEYCIVEVGQKIMNERDQLSKIVADQKATIATITATLKEEESRNETFSNCLHRALKLWQAKYPDKEFWPDAAENLAWVFEQLSAVGTTSRSQDISKIPLSDILGNSNIDNNHIVAVSVGRLRELRSKAHIEGYNECWDEEVADGETS